MDRKDGLDSISASLMRLDSIFKNSFFVVPSFQRGYKWSHEQVEKLVDDLWESFEDSKKGEEVEEYFLGALMLQESDKQDIREYSLIDGQQRITTLLLLFSNLIPFGENQSIQESIRSAIVEKASAYASKGDEIIKIHFQERDKTNDYLKNEIIAKLASNFETITAKKHKNADIINLQKNFFLIKKLLSEKKKKDVSQFIQFVFEKVGMIQITTRLQKNAFHFFEILNNRGLDLSKADIIKSQNIGKIGDKEKGSYTRKWEDMESAFIGEKKGDFEHFLSHIRLILTKKKAKRNILYEFENFIYGKQLEQGKGVIDYIVEYFKIYEALFLNADIKDSRVKNILESMNFITFNDWKAILIAYFQKFEEVKLFEFLKKLERLVFFQWVSKKSGTQRIEELCDILKLIVCDQVIVEGILKCDNLSEYSEVQIEDLKRNLRKDVHKEKWCKYTLLKYELSHYSGELSLSNFKSLTIEHVFPQNSTNKDCWEEELRMNSEEYVNKLGNLTLITGRTNSKLGNLCFKDKKKKYLSKKQIFERAQNEVLDKEKWGSKEITERTESVISHLLKPVK